MECRNVEETFRRPCGTSGTQKRIAQERSRHFRLRPAVTNFARSCFVAQTEFRRCRRLFAIRNSEKSSCPNTGRCPRRQTYSAQHLLSIGQAQLNRFPTCCIKCLRLLDREYCKEGLACPTSRPPHCYNRFHSGVFPKGNVESTGSYFVPPQVSAFLSENSNKCREWSTAASP